MIGEEAQECAEIATIGSKGMRGEPPLLFEPRRPVTRRLGQIGAGAPAVVIGRTRHLLRQVEPAPNAMLEHAGEERQKFRSLIAVEESGMSRAECEQPCRCRRADRKSYHRIGTDQACRSAEYGFFRRGVRT